MKNKIIFVIMALVFLDLHQAQAGKLTDDVSQSMYFRRSAYSDTAPAFIKFKEDMKQRERHEIRKMREAKLKKKWLGQTSRENEDFKDIKEQAPLIQRGSTTQEDILEMIKNPVMVKAPLMPWIQAQYRLREYLFFAGYPEPRVMQNVLAGRYYYTEYYLPRMGIRLDLLATLNNYTKFVDYSQNYLDTGYIQKYWLTN